MSHNPYLSRPPLEDLQTWRKPQKRKSILRPKRRPLVSIVAITLVASTVAIYFLAIHIPSTAIIPCVTTGHTHCFTIVASSNG
ncbi:hypothetical protein E6H31_07125 [Candidatus Bathyarchaeota archaeon]|nr:MAG: hypothetical protein E6H31_07125 [Candidatus Bathyarchaeota archaeon]